jgi:hypothetical protein
MPRTAAPITIDRVAVEPEVFALAPDYVLGVVALPAIEVFPTTEAVDDLLRRTDGEVFLPLDAGRPPPRTRPRSSPPRARRGEPRG